MKKLASELEFISQIKRDGSGVKRLKKSYLNLLLSRNDTFNLTCLSITEKTFIAFNFNAFVVRIKDNKIVRHCPNCRHPNTRKESLNKYVCPYCDSDSID